jgi:hypothetical protein
MSKKILSFIGPAHHIQLMRPVERELQARGWEVVRFTADTEALFQVGLMDFCPGDPFLWLPDYTDFPYAEALYEKAAPFFRELYMTPNEMSLLPAQMADKVIRSVCQEYTAIENLLKKEKPHACFALHEINRWGRLLGYHASRKRIPFWTLQEGLYYGDPWLYTGHTATSTSFVWGEATRRVLEASGCDPVRIVVVGHPDFTSRIRLARSQADAFRQSLPDEMPKRKRALLFIGNVDVQGAAAELFAGWDEQEEWGLLIKCHQLSSVPVIDRVKGLLQGHKNIHFIEGEGEEPGDLWRALAVADVGLIAGCSSVTLEMAAVGLPIGVFVDPLGHRNYTVDPPVALDVSHMPWVEAIRKVVTHWEEQCGARCREWLADEISVPGDAAGRIADRIEREL